MFPPVLKLLECKIRLGANSNSKFEVIMVRGGCCVPILTWGEDGKGLFFNPKSQISYLNSDIWNLRSEIRDLKSEIPRGGGLGSGVQMRDRRGGRAYLRRCGWVIRRSAILITINRQGHTSGSSISSYKWETSLGLSIGWPLSLELLWFCSVSPF